ncbi:hypothetical protein D0T12_21300 [Actinomadura spongiicola]|uniref:Uncharacterized protein n=1 Tax=Actinomadura spongiicola TaxID=2303421 RepID=A0A372GEE8_9ACTN|nr:hypothetical protein [Actinomadura spongiicola]RFS83572.1 hypothetical protein D0T12_21300 [Actinomadura spongiicola]
MNASSQAWPFVIVQTKILLAPDFLLGPRLSGRLLDAANPGPLSTEKARARTIELSGRQKATIYFRAVRIAGKDVGRDTEWIRDVGSRPMVMIEGVVLRGGHGEIDEGLLDLARTQVLPAVRDYVDHPATRPEVRASCPVGKQFVSEAEEPLIERPPVTVPTGAALRQEAADSRHGQSLRLTWRIAVGLGALGAAMGIIIWKILRAVIG